MATAITWPETTARPRNDSSWWQACWLITRNPQLKGLVQRLPGFLHADEQGEVDFELRKLSEAFRALDAYRAAWKKYEQTHYPPRDDDAYERWADAGPKLGDDEPGRIASAIAPMSRTEQGRLRLLATLGDERVEFCTGDLSGWDDQGHALIRDWMSLLT
ncbi:MAG TPA: hypothetical protein VFP72_13460 [Kineosporiaceae bacterium]|nr:hypothetical protein [Kineosporiaceae bacterium]